ncbi:hypothetical protein [Paraburkholderia youngii]|uniref:hypothetical protein n=1 Tax=Paraburkholderia youngii TaxID=2782701 RepID=UPI003D1F5EE4
MDKGWSSRTEFLERHVWTEGRILLAASLTVYTVTKYFTHVIEADALGLHPGGWLEAAVDSAPNPMAHSNAYNVVRFIAILARDPQHHARLERPIPLLQRDDVLAVFEGLDAAIADIASPHTETGAVYSQRVRAFLSAPTIPLATGDLIRSVPYHTSLQTPVRRARDTLSDRPHPNLVDSELAKPAAALEFTDLEDLHTKQIAHFEGRNRVLRELCTTVLDSHDFVVDAISAARRTGIHELDLPRNIYQHLINKKKLPKHTHAKIPNDALLPICVYLLDANELYKNVYAVKLPTQQIEAFAPLRSGPGQRHQLAILRSEHYLTKNVLMACLIILMLETKWNSSTVLSLTEDRIEEIDGKYYLNGYKSKSGQHQSSEVTGASSNNGSHQAILQAEVPKGLISKISEEVTTGRVEVETPAAVRAIRLLLKHRSNIDKHWNTETRQLFLFLTLRPERNYPDFRVPIIAVEVRAFCRFINHPPFQIDDLRKQTVSTKYLQTGDLRQAQADLGHAKVGTTLAYINGQALRHSKEAIIKHFGEVLSDSYLYYSGKLILNPNATERRSRLAKKLLLFPPSSLHPEDGDSIADRWLQSKGGFSFEVGHNEISWCVYQKKYYRKNCAKLVFENPKRFNHYHLPRILFCEALYNFIAASPLGSKLKDIEGNQK